MDPTTDDATAQVAPCDPEEGAPAAPADEGPWVAPERRGYHGFRLGYTYVNGAGEGPDPSLRSPHLFVMGYELTQRAIGGSWLDVIVVENVSLAGINQSVVAPSFNGLVGFEIRDQVEVGTGISVSPFDPDGKYVHQLLAIGWTPPAGAFRVPLHLTLIPDVDGHWRVGTTIGVNW